MESERKGTAMPADTTMETAMLVIDARTGYCRVLAERLGVEINAVKVFEPAGADGSKGTSVDIKARPVTAGHAAKLVKHVLLKRKTEGIGPM